MEQRRGRPARPTEGRKRRKRKTAGRRILSSIVRGVMVILMMTMLFLMLCGCLYIRDFFRTDEGPVRETEAVRVAASSFPEEASAAPLEENNCVVVLDAGHGGKDGGTMEQQAAEKEISLALVLKMKELLEDRGIHVVLTRDSDIFLKLEDRVRIANEENPDLFLSIHCNYYEKDSAIRGLECYYCADAQKGKYYAGKIMEEMERRGNITLRNMKPADYYVLKNTTAPAVLVEAGYLSNDRERAELMSETCREKLAEELVEGILRGLGDARRDFPEDLSGDYPLLTTDRTVRKIIPIYSPQASASVI